MAELTDEALEEAHRQCRINGLDWGRRRDYTAIWALAERETRAKVAEEIAKAIATNPNVEHSCCDCGDSQDIYAAIARTYGAKPAETAVEAPAAHAESHRMGEGSSGAQEAVG